MWILYLIKYLNERIKKENVIITEKNELNILHLKS